MTAAVGLVLGACGATSGSVPAGSGSASPPPSETLVAPDHLVVNTGPPPWQAPVNDVASRASAAGLSMLTAEGQGLHIHAHLDVFVNGQPVTVPAYLGIDLVAGEITSLHTHDATGIIHVESPVNANFTLGQLFTEWGVRLGSGCVAGYCAPAAPSAVYAGGVRQPGDPAAVEFHAHEEVALVIGTPPAAIPNKYNFPDGY
jgi:hypothetical protein